MWKQLLSSTLMITTLVACMASSTYAAFTAEATVSGISFSTGRAELKLFGNLGYTNAGNNGNLTRILPGRSFEGIGPNWSERYPLKYFNTGSLPLQTSIQAHFDEEDEAAVLAEHITVQVSRWNDLDGDGNPDSSDTYEAVGEPQTLAELKNSPLSLGEHPNDTARGLVLDFSTEDLPSETQDQSLEFSIILHGTTAGTTP